MDGVRDPLRPLRLEEPRTPRANHLARVRVRRVGQSLSRSFHKPREAFGAHCGFFLVGKICHLLIPHLPLPPPPNSPLLQGNPQPSTRRHRNGTLINSNSTGPVLALALYLDRRPEGLIEVHLGKLQQILQPSFIHWCWLSAFSYLL